MSKYEYKRITRCEQSFTFSNSWLLLTFIIACMCVNLLHDCTCDAKKALVLALYNTLHPGRHITKAQVWGYRKCSMLRKTHRRSCLNEYLMKKPVDPVGSKALQWKLVSCVNHRGRTVDLKLTFALWPVASLSRQSQKVCTQRPSISRLGTEGAEGAEDVGGGRSRDSQVELQRSEGQREAVGLWDPPWSLGQCSHTTSLCDAMCVCSSDQHFLSC